MVKTRPKKPRKNFPLFAHQNGQWAKKICGRLYYFGTWDNPDRAEEKYLYERDFLQAGRVPPTPDAIGCRLSDLCNSFLTSKQSLLDTGEITSVTFLDYHRSCELMVEFFKRDTLIDDLGAREFEKYRNHLAKTRGIVALGNEINRSRIVFKYAFDCDLIEKPIKFGQTFRQPSKKALRIHRQKRQQQHGKRMLDSAEIRILIEAATSPMRAMILLGINGGLGAADLAAMPHSVLNLELGWLDYPRPKTGVERRIPLWKETTIAIREAIDIRSGSHLVFVTREGNAYRRVLESGAIRNSVMEQFSKLLTRLSLKRHGLGFYALRHTFETVGGESRDQVAVDFIMGHADQSMSSLYREHISDDRLQAVVDHVHNWLWPRA